MTLTTRPLALASGAEASLASSAALRLALEGLPDPVAIEHLERIAERLRGALVSVPQWPHDMVADAREMPSSRRIDYLLHFCANLTSRVVRQAKTDPGAHEWLAGLFSNSSELLQEMSDIDIVSNAALAFGPDCSAVTAERVAGFEDAISRA